MPNQLNASGLTTATHSELLATMTSAFQTIYGADVNLESSTPDGQMMNIFIQAILDNLDLLTQVYNSFDPDNAIGVVLDQRVTYNGIQRLAGTYTKTNITVVTSQALNLFGSDQSVEQIFIVADNAGNKWELETTTSIPSAGTYVMQFKSIIPGAVLTTPNTITIPVTIVLGVSSINNPTTYTTLGLDEETDAALRIRRLQSVSISSQGFLSSMLAAVENVNGVTSASVYENNTGSTDAYGVPAHSIWVVVDGTPLDADIANAIYGKRNAGCGMLGTKTYTIVQLDGSPFVIHWDAVVQENVFIKFTATSIDGVFDPNTAAILAQLPLLFVPKVNETININDLATYVQQIDNNCLVTNAGFSTTLMGTYTNILSPSSKNKQFLVTSGDITIL